jgi:hypothetical protein
MEFFDNKREERGGADGTGTTETSMAHTTYAQIVRPKFTLNDHSMFSSIKLDQAKSCRVGQRKALSTNTNTMEPAAMQTFSR